MSEMSNEKNDDITLFEKKQVISRLKCRLERITNSSLTGMEQRSTVGEGLMSQFQVRHVNGATKAPLGLEKIYFSNGRYSLGVF